MFKKALVSILPPPLIENFEFFLLKHYKMSKGLMAYSNPELMEMIGEKKALYVFKRAAQHIPAYRKFLKKHKLDPKKIKNIKDFKTIPPTTKENYVKLNSYEALCLGGKLPASGIIEESAGSTGNPTNWIKSFSESLLLDESVDFEANYILNIHNKPTIIISCWSPGPWTTDLKFCEFFEHQGLVKNVGPDIEGVVRTIKNFGPKYHYVIAGYPPFCRVLLEKTRKQINWKKHHLDLLVGGEGFVIGWRNHIRDIAGKNVRVFSAYGASDVDIGVAFETPLTIEIRKLIAENKNLTKRFVRSGRYPMIFQYNTLSHHIANIDEKAGERTEFTITPLDLTVVAPKVKYNLHDEGKKFSFNELIGLLKEKGGKKIDQYLKKNKGQVLYLPFLMVYGRSDGTISINGTNIYPQQVELALMKDKHIFSKTFTFRISDEHQRKPRLVIKVELKEGIKPTQKLKIDYKKTILRHLPKVSEEYAQARKEFNKEFTPHIEHYTFGTGPFSQKESKIKHQYIEKKKK